MALLEHNQKVYDEAVEYFKNGGKDLLIVQDTGTGKSFICAELLNTIFKGMSVLYVVPVLRLPRILRTQQVVLIILNLCLICFLKMMWIWMK